MEGKDVKALISLLDDPDEGIYNHIKDKIISLGKEVIPDLEEAWEQSPNQDFQKRVENIIHQIQFDGNLNELFHWAKNEQHNLLKGVLIVAHYQYPELDQEKVLKTIDRIRQDIWLELNDNLTALEKVKMINHILFDVHAFSGNVDNYHSPQNSFINTVLESKKGNPLSLSILYAILAQSLGIPIYGVNLPEHFILAYVDSETVDLNNEELKKHPILFYVNAFSKGTIFARKEIDNFLKQLKIEPRPPFYEPCTNLEIIKRVLRNLILAFEKINENDKKREVEFILTQLEELKL